MKISCWVSGVWQSFSFPVLVGFVVDEVSLEQVFFRVLLFSCVSIILIMLYTQLLLYLLLEARGVVEVGKPWNFLINWCSFGESAFLFMLKLLTSNDPYMGRTAPLTSKRWIIYICSTNIGTKNFKHALYSPFFSLQNAVCFIMLNCLVSVLFTFCIQGVIKLKKIIPTPKG